VCKKNNNNVPHIEGCETLTHKHTEKENKERDSTSRYKPVKGVSPVDPVENGAEKSKYNH
jgi:hypothetical protein